MLTTVAAVEAILGRDLDATQEARVAELITLAQDAIEGRLGRSAEGQAFTGATFTLWEGAKAVFLDHFPIASVQKVTEAGTELTAGTEYAADLPTGIITRRLSGYPAFWNFGTDAVVVDYTSATVAELATLCARIAARTFKAGEAAAAAPSVMAGFRQLTIGRWSGTADAAGSDAVAALELNVADLATVDRWRDREP